jgi:hypothetical protein
MCVALHIPARRDLFQVHAYRCLLSRFITRNLHELLLPSRCTWSSPPITSIILIVLPFDAPSHHLVRIVALKHLAYNIHKVLERRLRVLGEPCVPALRVPHARHACSPSQKQHLQRACNACCPCIYMIVRGAASSLRVHLWAALSWCRRQAPQACATTCAAVTLLRAPVTRASTRALPALELLLGSKRHGVRCACTRGMKRVDERQRWCWLMLGFRPYMPGSRSVSCGIVCSNGSRASGAQSAG